MGMALAHGFRPTTLPTLFMTFRFRPIHHRQLLGSDVQVLPQVSVRI
uniref:Uncharacterized protein n=1 Tax=Setaria italica TaxID=4555 RepID=K3Y3S9_SETIT